ncbi:bifunctional folylpolyglutamate synthase/dihydrofolate synthase [Desulfonauticus submarinus]
MFKTIQEVNKYLSQLGLFKMKLGLDRVQAGLKKINLNPDFCPIVHIVGTNGKGSTAHFLESLSRSHGLKTGLFTSPHLISVKERIKINNTILSNEEWIESANYILQNCKSLKLTYFEFIFLLACFIFKEHKVNIAFFEAGLGGKFDATNVLYPFLTLFTPISLDHTQILGSNISQIARDKAGVIKKSLVVSAKQTSTAKSILIETAKNKNVLFKYAPDYSIVTDNCLIYYPWEMNLPISPYLLDFQKENLQLVFSAWDAIVSFFQLKTSSQLILEAINNTFIVGRLQQVSKDPDIYLDVAHNPAAISLLKKTFSKLKIFPQTVVFSCLKDKDIQTMLKILKEISPNIYFCQIPSNSRSLLAQDISSKFNLPFFSSIKQSLDYSSQQKSVLFCGSFYLLSEIFKLKPRWQNINFLLKKNKIF